MFIGVRLFIKVQSKFPCNHERVKWNKNTCTIHGCDLSFKNIGWILANIRDPPNTFWTFFQVFYEKERTNTRARSGKKITKNISIYEARYIVCFVWSSWELTNRGTSCHALGIFKKHLMSRGAPTRFVTVWSCSVKVIDYWTIFLMKSG
jgi:hypothetical protein